MPIIPIMRGLPYALPPLLNGAVLLHTPHTSLIRSFEALILSS
jgi:hypothetical protein